MVESTQPDLAKYIKTNLKLLLHLIRNVTTHKICIHPFPEEHDDLEFTSKYKKIMQKENKNKVENKVDDVINEAEKEKETIENEKEKE